MTEELYIIFHDYFEQHHSSRRLLQLLVGVMTSFVFCTFGMILFYLVASRQLRAAYEVVLVCAVGFAGCTVLRRFVNAKRPYEVYELAPTLNRDKKGDSFPSRHVFSITMIAIAAARVSHTLSALLVLMTIFLAVARVIGGVHFIKDVVFGAFLAVLWSWIGYWILYLI